MLPIIPWCGEYNHPDDLLSNTEVIQMINTCTLDNFLQILLVFYFRNVEQMQRLFSYTDPLLHQVNEIIQYLLTNNFISAKYAWFTQICNMTPDSNGNIDTYGDDKQITLYPLRNIFRRKYEFSICSSDQRPLNFADVKNDVISDMNLYSPHNK